MNPAAMIGLLFVAFAGTLVLGFVMKWVDRKVTAMVQWRVGPPWYQPFADVAKLLGKETIIPQNARRTGFLLAPMLGFAAVVVAATILWGVNLSPKASFVGDLIVVLYLLTIPSLAVVIGGAASSNPHGAVGASREMKLILSYELPLVLAMVPAMIAGGWTLKLGAIMTTPSPSVWTSVAMAAGFVVALLCVQAKLGLVPFDIAEAETEIMGGAFVEYSGAPLALIYLTRAMMLAVMPILLVTVLWGGFTFASVGGAIASILKYVLVIVVTVLVRNTNPRVRVDHAMKFFWFGLTPVALLAVVLALVGSAQ
ncbi:MAG: NADH-quinone oxidoreductase subunit H [Planctomycetes bacterium]|nr:NADH-quinone oxidoreductase subunit H [Planctomycetota bacterium]